MNTNNIRTLFMFAMVIVVAAAVVLALVFPAQAGGIALGVGAGLTVGIAGTVLLVDAINRGRTP